MIVAQAYSIGQLAIALVVLVAVAALVMVAVRASGIPVPPWVMQVLGIVVVAFVVIVAIRIVLSM